MYYLFKKQLDLEVNNLMFEKYICILIFKFAKERNEWMNGCVTSLSVHC